MKVRPKYVCNKLFPDSPVTAMFLDDLIFWGNYTKLREGNNPLVVITFSEWEGILGLTKRQLERSLVKLKAADLVRVHSRRHKLRKEAMKVLQIEIDADFLSLTNQITSGDWSLAALSIALHGGVTNSTAGGALYSTLYGAIPLIVDKNKDKSNCMEVSAEPQTSVPKPQVKEKAFMASMGEILADLKKRQEKGKYTITEKAVTSEEPIELWRSEFAKAYGDVHQGMWTNVQKKQMKEMLAAYGADGLTKMLIAVLSRWNEFGELLVTHKGYKGYDQYPDFKVVYAQRDLAVRFSRGEYAVAAPLHSSAKNETPAETLGNKKLQSLMAKK